MCSYNQCRQHAQLNTMTMLLLSCMSMKMSMKHPNCWVLGHSLGAGVAALLSLKMHVRASALKCWAFCPPGGLLSQKLSHAAEEYCTSVIVNKDMVPRLSLKTVYRLFEGELNLCIIRLLMGSNGSHTPVIM